MGPGGATVTNLWSGSLHVTPGRTTVRNTTRNGALAPGGTASFGFTANGTAGTPPPQCAGS
ncbi:cellulose binding domain-containing protein [Streptomyces sp. NPDC003016]